MTQELIAVDWGTSSFRANLMNAQGESLEKISDGGGVSKVAQSEQLDYLKTQTLRLTNNTDLAYYMCGMVGSNIGLTAVPYLECPIEAQTLANNLFDLQKNGFDISGSIVPGLKCSNYLGEPDVMRGEETQIVGWLSSNPELAQQKVLLCLPGTHNKWVIVNKGTIETFITAFTGELFDHLNKHSVLIGDNQSFNDDAFQQGLQRSHEGDLTHLFFSARSRVLDQKLPAEHASSYLSGIIIGSDVGASLARLMEEDIEHVHIIGDSKLNELYRSAVESYHYKAKTYSGDILSIKGLQALHALAQTDT